MTEPLSLSGRTSYRKISRSFEAASLGAIIIVLLRNVIAISAALLPMSLSKVRAIWDV